MVKEEKWLVHSKCPRDGHTVVEYLCPRDWGPGIRDLLDELIEEGASVTAWCYDNVLMNNHGDTPSPDMLKSLMDSGVFPLELGDGSPTLDAIAEHIDNNEYMGEILAQFLQKNQSSGSANKLELEPGKTHEEDGVFSK